MQISGLGISSNLAQQLFTEDFEATIAVLPVQFFSFIVFTYSIYS